MRRGSFLRGGTLPRERVELLLRGWVRGTVSQWYPDTARKRSGGTKHREFKTRRGNLDPRLRGRGRVPFKWDPMLLQWEKTDRQLRKISA